MTTPQDYAVNATRASRYAYAGERVSVTFPDGAVVSNVLAICADFETETESESGVILELRLKTFAMKAADLGREPERNMEITWRGNNYTARNPAGAKVWSYLDHGQTEIEIQTEKAPPKTQAGAPYRAPDQTVYSNPAGIGYGKP